MPGLAGAEELSLSARVVQLADYVEAFHFSGGTEAALDVARRKRGTHFDPELVDVFCRHSGEVLAGIDELSAWDEVIALDPRLGLELSDDGLDQALEAIGDYADLKSPCRTGHARGVADVAAATALGLDGIGVRSLRRAALVHDVGMIGIPSGVWEETKNWSLSQRERARTHPYLLERMPAHTPLFGDIVKSASMHHERLDGSGYPGAYGGSQSPCLHVSSPWPTCTRHLGSHVPIGLASTRTKRRRSCEEKRAPAGLTTRRCMPCCTAAEAERGVVWSFRVGSQSGKRP